MGRSVRWSRRQPQRTRLCGHARLHGRPRARRSLCRTSTRTPVCAIHRTPAAQAQNRSNAQRSSRCEIASRVPEGRRRGGQALSKPGAYRGRSRPKARHGGVAANERKDFGCQYGSNLQSALGGAWTHTSDGVEAGTWAVYQRGLKVSGVEYIEAIAAAHAIGRKMAAFLASYDVILSTTLADSGG